VIGASAAFFKRDVALRDVGYGLLRIHAIPQRSATRLGVKVFDAQEVFDTRSDDFAWDAVILEWDGTAGLAAGQRLAVFTLTTNDAGPCVGESTPGWTEAALVESLSTSAGGAGRETPTAQNDRWLYAGGVSGGDPALAVVGREKLRLDVPSGPGRFVAVGVLLEPGDGPALACWATGPRQSWLDDLPAVFRENPVAAAFLERFLATFKVEWDRIAEVLDHFDRYLRPDRAPSPDALRFLAGWFALQVPNAGPGLGLVEQRRYVATVLPLRERRGQPEALATWLRAWLELKGIDTAGGRLPRFVEGFRIRRFIRPDDVASAVGADLDKAAPLGPEVAAGGARLDAGHRLDEVALPSRDRFAGWEEFVDRSLWVFLPPLGGREDDGDAPTLDDELAELLDELVPTDLDIRRRVVRPGLVLGHDSLLGLNTVPSARQP
jgi:phage tail-like protein